MRDVLYAGNTGIARRYRDAGTNGNSMRALLIGDSISVNLQGSLQRSLKPGKWTGFIGTTSVSTAEVNLGIGLVTYPNDAGVFSTPDNAHKVFTGNGVAAPDGLSVGDAACMALRVDIATPSVWDLQMFPGDFIWEAIGRGVRPVVEALIKKTATGDNLSFFYAYSANNAQVSRTPSSGFLTCFGSGYSKVSISVPLNAPITAPNGNLFGFRLPNSQESIDTKTITVGNHFHLSTGEAGFEFGTLAVGGTSTTDWSAVDGVMPDAYISALVSNYLVSDFWILLGANDGDQMARDLPLLLARLRRLNPGCGIVIISTYALHTNYDADRQANQAAVGRTVAITDGNTLFLDLYHCFGTYKVNYSNTGGGTAYSDNYGIGDGVHPDDTGRRGAAELIDMLLQLAASETSGQLSWNPFAPKRWN